MSFMKKSAAGLVLTASALAASTAFAAGFQLTEQSSLGLGRAYAGAGIVGDDLSAVHYNPAGMTLLPGTQIQAGTVYIDVDAEYSGNDGAENNGRMKGQLIPAGYTTYQVNDKLWLGFGMTVPFGMGTEYGRGWEENTSGTSAKIYTFDMNPSFAYKVSDFISIGAGVSVQYAKAKLGKMALNHPQLGSLHSKVEGDSWDWGYNFGIMISPNDKMRFGLAYRSSIEHNASGDTKLSGNGKFSALGGQIMSMDTTIETPATVMLTGTWEATQDLRISGLIRWAEWSNFDTLALDNEVNALMKTVASQFGDLGSALINGLDNVEIENKWQDTWLFSVGADYRINDTWTVRGGIAYETGAVDDEKYRVAVIPDTDRLWLSLGATYNWSKKLQFDVAATMLKGIGNRDLYEYGTDTKAGEFDNLDCYILGAQMQYRF